MKKKKRRRVVGHRVKSLGFTAAQRKYLNEMRKRQTLSDTADLGGLSVVAFGNPALREAFRIWWHPYQMGDDFEQLRGSRTRNSSKGQVEVISGSSLELDRLDPDSKKRMARWARNWRTFEKTQLKIKRRPSKLPPPKRGRCPVKVKLVVDYPVRTKQVKIVTLDRRYPGEIFAVLHDFYREIYAKDEALGGKQGPSGTMLNRGAGPIVRFHDISDLVVESVHYRATPKDKDNCEGTFQFGIGS